MTNDEARAVLALRRNLTGATFNDDTVAAWQLALRGVLYDEARDAVIVAAREVDHVNVHAVAVRLPQHPPAPLQHYTEPADVISLDEYLRRLKRRADAGSVDAQRELLSFKRRPVL